MHSSSGKIKIEGYLTIYMALSIAVLVSLITVLIEGARQNTARMDTEIAMDIAMQSVLAEYHQELWEKYDLLFVDMSYGGSKPNEENIAIHINNYMEKNLSHSRFLEMETSSADVLAYSLASDQDGEVLRKQAISYMKTITGQSDIEKWIQNYSEMTGNQFESKDYTKEQEQNQKNIETHPIPKKKEKESHYDPINKKTVVTEKETEIPIENPAQMTNAKRNISVLNLVIDNPENLSNASVDLEEYISHRKDMLCGNLIENVDNANNVVDDMIEKMLYQKYIFDKLGHYGMEKDETRLKYQIEYIIAGKSSDQDNLKTIIKRLLVMREASNLMYIKSNSTKMEEIEVMALGVAAVSASPDLYPLIKESITFAWAFLESVQDVKGLLQGEKVPLVKTKDSWRTNLSEILEAKDKHISKKTKYGLTYQEYLVLLMSIENRKVKNLRMMDIIEMDIRQSSYNENFRMDACVESMQAKAVVLVRNGSQCEITRKYSYAK